MPKLKQTVTVLKFDHVAGERVCFSSDVLSVDLDPVAYEEMGLPRVLTVTVRPGDELNAVA